MKPNIIVDTRGLFCPMPIIKASEAMQKIDSGGVIEVISDDPAIESDMPAWCGSHGHTVVKMTRSGENYHYLVKKV